MGSFEAAGNFSQSTVILPYTVFSPDDLRFHGNMSEVCKHLVGGKLYYMG